MAKENTPEDQSCAKEGVGSGFWDNRDGHSMNPAQFLFQSPSMFPADFMGQQQRDPLSSSLYPQFFGDVASHSGSPWNEPVDANRNDGPILINRPVYSGFAHNNLTSGSSSLQEGSEDQYIDCGRTYNLFNGAHWDLRNLTTMNDQPRYIPIGQNTVESIIKGKENEEPKLLTDTPKKENQVKPSYKEILSKSASLSKIIPQSPSSSPYQVDPVKVSPPSSRQGDTARTRLSVRNSLPPTPTHGVQKSEKKSIVDIDDEFVLSRDAATLSFGSWGLGSLETGKKKSKPSDVSVTAEHSVSPGRTKNVLKDLKKSSCNGSAVNADQLTELKSSSATKRQRDVKVSNEEGSDGSSSRSELPPAHKCKPKSRETTKRRDESDKSATKSYPKSGLKKRRENDVFDNRWVKIAQDLSFKWMYGMLALTMWLVNLIVDVASLGLVASKDGVSSFMEWFRNIGKTVTTVAVLAIRHHLTRFYDLYLKRVLSFFRRKSVNEEKKNAVSNIPLPATGEEAMRRLLACKGKDPYSILGVSRSCSDEEIKRYYRKQAILVHPDKNRQAGAEEAFKILAHAFEIVGEPNRRHEYDQAEREKKLVESAEGELSDLLDALQRKMDEAVNTIKCTNCNQRHRRVKTGRPLYAGRFCGECNIYHQAKDGELWAESRWMGLKWTYLACMENTIFEITEWGNCQSGSLRHLKPNVHAVQYKLKPWSVSAPNQNQEQRRNTYQDPADLSDNEWENLLAGMYKNCNFGHGPPGDRSATQKPRKAKKKAK